MKKTDPPPKDKKPRRGKAAANEAPPPAAPPNMPMPAHLYVGPRDVKIKLGEEGMLRVLRDQQALRREITEQTDLLLAKQTQIDEAQELLARRRAEFREVEDTIEDRKDRILAIIEANADGFHLDRVEVDEYFLSGEIVTYRKGTKEEVGQRRNATPSEWEAAQNLRTDGKPATRWQKGKPSSKAGFVLIEGCKGDPKEVRASGEYGYIGPDEDPTKPPKKQSAAEDKKKPKEAKEPKVLPHSLKSVPPAAEVPAADAGTAAVEPPSEGGLDEQPAIDVPSAPAASKWPAPRHIGTEPPQPSA